MWRRLIFSTACLSFLVAMPAHAQDAIVVDLQRRIISERRLADDRELALLRNQEHERLSLQNDLDAARRRGSGALKQVEALQARLNDLGRKERALVAQILSRDPASQLMVQDLQAELSQLSATGSPETKAAIAEFGRGDRLRAWPKVEALAKKGSARDKRVAARLRTIMFNFQDKGVTAQDVLTRWAEASKADPDNTLALASLAVAQQYVGQTEAALATLATAKARAKNPLERQAIAWQMASIASSLQKPELMVTLLEEQLEATRLLKGNGISEAARKWSEAETEISLAGYLMNVGKNAEAVDMYSKAAETIGRLRVEAPTWRVDDTLAGTYMYRANAEYQLNRVEAALKSYGEAIALLEARIANDPGDTAASTIWLAQAYTSACNIYVQQNLVGDALRTCGRALELEKKQPQSAARDYLVAGNAAYVGRLLMIAQKGDEAKAMFTYSVGLWRALARINSAPMVLAGYADAITALAGIDPEICWRDVAAAWKALEEKGSLSDYQRRLYLHARVNGRAGLGCDLKPPPSNHSDQ